MKKIVLTLIFAAGGALFLGCGTYNYEHTVIENPNEEFNPEFIDWRKEQTKIVNSYLGKKFKLFIKDNPIKFDEKIAVPDADGGYFFTVKVSPPMHYSTITYSTNEYGSKVRRRNFGILSYNLFANSDGILEEVTSDIRSKSFLEIEEESLDEKKAKEQQAVENLAGSCISGVILAAILILLEESSSGGRY